MKKTKKVISIISTIALALQVFSISHVMAEVTAEPTETVIMDIDFDTKYPAYENETNKSWGGQYSKNLVHTDATAASDGKFAKTSAGTSGNAYHLGYLPFSEVVSSGRLKVEYDFCKASGNQMVGFWLGNDTYQMINYWVWADNKNNVRAFGNSSLQKAISTGTWYKVVTELDLDAGTQTQMIINKSNNQVLYSDYKGSFTAGIELKGLSWRENTDGSIDNIKVTKIDYTGKECFLNEDFSAETYSLNNSTDVAVTEGYLKAATNACNSQAGVKLTTPVSNGIINLKFDFGYTDKHENGYLGIGDGYNLLTIIETNWKGTVKLFGTALVGEIYKYPKYSCEAEINLDTGAVSGKLFDAAGTQVGSTVNTTLGYASTTAWYDAWKNLLLVKGREYTVFGFRNAQGMSTDNIEIYQEYKIETQEDDASILISEDYEGVIKNLFGGQTQTVLQENGNKYLQIGNNTWNITGNSFAAQDRGTINIAFDFRSPQNSSGYFLLQGTPWTDAKDNFPILGFAADGTINFAGGSGRSLGTTTANVWYHYDGTINLTTRYCNVTVTDLNGNAVGSFDGYLNNSVEDDWTYGGWPKTTTSFNKVGYLGNAQPKDIDNLVVTKVISAPSISQDSVEITANGEVPESWIAVPANNVSVTVDFKTEMDSETLADNVYVVSSDGTKVSATGIFDGYSKYTLPVTTEPANTYKIVITTGAQNIMNVGIPSNQEFEFTTLAGAVSGTINVLKNSELVDEFSDISDGDVLTIDIPYTNTKAASENYKLIIAYYNSNRLISGIDIQDVEIPVGSGTASKTHTVSKGTADSLMIFLWDNFDYIRPVAESVKLQSN